MRLRESVIGVLDVQSDRLDAFRPGDLTALLGESTDVVAQRIVRFAKLYVYYGHTQPLFNASWFPLPGWYITTNMFFDALTQYDPRQHQFNANLRFNVIHHPLSDLFVVVNQQRITTPDAPATGFGVIVKFTQMLSI